MSFTEKNPHVIRENYNPTEQDLQKANDEYAARKKPTHSKPAVYAHIYQMLQEIARSYGYNLLIHGSMSRDLDLVAVPWFPNFTFAPNREAFIGACRMAVGGIFNDGHGNELSPGRLSYVINLNRGGYKEDVYTEDPQWYIDISVFESYTELKEQITTLQSQLSAAKEELETLKKLKQ